MPRTTQTLLALAWPTVVTFLAFATRQFTDAWMVARLGTEALAALMPAQQVLFLVHGFGYGMFSALNTCAAQAENRHNQSTAGVYAWQGIWLALGLGLIFSLPYFFTRQIFGIFDHEFDVYVMEVAYFEVAIWSTTAQFLAVALANFFFATRHPIAPMWSGLLHVVLNFALNYIFMFGAWGIVEPMGIAGAAWGTVISCFVWALILFLIFLFHRGMKPYQTRRPVFSRVKMWVLARLGLLNGAFDIVDILFWNIALVALVGNFGTEHLAASTIILSLLMLILVPGDGVAVAVATQVGLDIGRNEPEKANQKVWICVWINAGFMVTAGFICLSLREVLFGFMNVEPVVREIGFQILWLLPMLLFFDSLLYAVDSGLTGAGDARWPLVTTMILNFTLILGAGLIVTVWKPELQSFGIWVCVLVNRMALAIAMTIRWRSGRWKQVLKV